MPNTRTDSRPTALARRILDLVTTRDPLSENVHLSKFGAMRGAAAGLLAGSFARLGRGVEAASTTRNA